MAQSFVNPNYFSQYPYQNQVQAPMDRLQQLQAPYQVPQMQQPSQMPAANQGILWVQGEAGAKSYLVAPGTSVLLMDSESEQFFIKTMDSAGMPQPLRIFRYTEVLSGAQQPLKQPEMNLDDKYVTRQEYADLRSKYDELYGMLDEATNPVRKDK